MHINRQMSKYAGVSAVALWHLSLCPFPSLLSQVGGKESVGPLVVDFREVTGNVIE